MSQSPGAPDTTSGFVEFLLPLLIACAVFLLLGLATYGPAVGMFIGIGFLADRLGRRLALRFGMPSGYARTLVAGVLLMVAGGVGLAYPFDEDYRSGLQLGGEWSLLSGVVMFLAAAVRRPDQGRASWQPSLIVYLLAFTGTGLFVGVTFPSWNRQLGPARKAALRANAHEVQTMLEDYAESHDGQYPTALASLQKAAVPGRPWPPFTNPYDRKQPSLVAYTRSEAFATAAPLPRGAVCVELASTRYAIYATDGKGKPLWDWDHPWRLVSEATIRSNP